MLGAAIAAAVACFGAVWEAIARVNVRGVRVVERANAGWRRAAVLIKEVMPGVEEREEKGDVQEKETVSGHRVGYGMDGSRNGRLELP